MKSFYAERSAGPSSETKLSGERQLVRWSALGTSAEAMPNVAVSPMTVHAAGHDDELALDAVPECVLETVKKDAPVSSIHLGVQQRITSDSPDGFVDRCSELGAKTDALEFVPVLYLF